MDLQEDYQRIFGGLSVMGSTTTGGHYQQYNVNYAFTGRNPYDHKQSFHHNPFNFYRVQGR